MNRKKNLFIIAFASLLVSTTLFIIQIDRREPDLRVNAFEIIAGALIVFVPIVVMLYGIKPLFKFIKRRIW